jgi:beta-fructofuranosidase
MNYRPKADNLILWDTWMFRDPDGKRMHLFYLANLPKGHWEWVGHAVSEDLVHWEDMPNIQVRCPGDSYDVGVIGTGMVFEHRPGEYMMSYTAHLDSDRQQISFLHSNDLIKWEKKWPEPVFAAEPPYYETDKTRCISSPAFRDAYIHKVGEHFEALVGANLTAGPVLLRGGIARYRSLNDQLDKWKALPQLIGPNITALMEVPEHFQLGSKHYLIWSTSSSLGVECDTPTRRSCSGTFYAVSDNYDGPYCIPEDNLLIGAGGAIQSYVGRTIEWQGERLLYHHMAGPYPSSGMPKRVIQNEDGTLKLGYWPGIESIHAEAIDIPLNKLDIQGENMGAGTWISTSSSSLTGSIDGGGSLALAGLEHQDIHLRCKVTADATRFAVVLRDPGQFTDRENNIRTTHAGLALQGDIKHGEWNFGKPCHSWCSHISPIETIYEAPLPNRTYQLDLIARDIYFEVYIDGIWKFTRIVSDKSPKGRVGFYVEAGSVRFDEIHAWQLEPMSQPYPENLPTA